jgi:GAF domain-containing protein/nitrogen-specific signal transduction histidine kinase
MFASLNLGMGLIIAGLIFVILVWGVMGILPRSRARGQAAPSTGVPQDLKQSTDAVLVIQSGGRVDYVNPLAREWFGLRENDPPDLERLVRRVRPPDDFLDVCAAPGQKRLTINGKLVDVTSYQVPGVYPQMLVSLRGIDLSPMPGEANKEFSSPLSKIINDFNQSILASLDLISVLRSILENVSRLIVADLFEIKVWDEDERGFVTYRFQEVNGSGHKVVRTAQSQFGNLADQIIQTKMPHLIPDTRVGPRGEASGSFLSVLSYVGVPLMAGSELVGLLEVGQTLTASLSQQDLDLLLVLVGQTGVALHNALLFEQERRRAVELSGLANLAQAVSAIHEPQELFTRLVESITPLFNVDVLGFLLYDENKRTLEAQIPFQGLPPNIVQIYRASIAPNSPAEALLNERKLILTPNASQDASWSALGLTDIAIAASLRDSALMPLVSAGQMVGYFQVSHHHGGAAEFSVSEIRLMHIVSDQAAAIIENAVLVQQSRVRAQRADALRRISSLSLSSATLDEVLKYSLQELAGLFKADVAAIFLLDEARGELRSHRDSMIGVSAEIAGSYSNLVVDDPEYRQTVAGSQRALLSGHLSVDRRLPPFYGPLVKGLGMESVIVVPLIAREKTLGELNLASRKTDFFNDYDLQIITTAAGQLASAIESLRLVSQTDESLRRQVDQLTSIARVSREMSVSLSLDELLNVLHDETIRITGATCGSVLLLDLEAAFDETRVLQFVGCPYQDELSPLERTSIETGQSFHIGDFDQEGSFPPHSGIRSALVIPMSYQGRVAGLIQVHSQQPAFFDEDAFQTVQTLAIQASLALINATRYQDERQQTELLRRRADTLSKFSTTDYSISLEQPLEESLKIIAQGIRDTTPFQVVLISIFEPETGMLRRVTGLGISPETLNELMARKQPLASIQQLTKPEFKISRSYFIPADKTPVLPADIHYVYSEAYSESETRQSAWNPDDFLLIPLEDLQGTPLGLISLDDPSNGLRPDLATIDSVELFAAQAVRLISNSVRFTDLKGRIESLSSGLQRQQKLINVTKTDLPVLLRKDLEQTIALYNLDRRAQRVRAGLAITESVSRQLDASSALLALGRETLTQLSMTIALVAENAPEGPRLLHILGGLPKSSNPEALFGQRNPLRSVLQSGEPILISNLDDSEEWRNTDLLGQMRAKSVICLPVMVENRPIAAMLAISQEPLPAFTEEDKQVYYQISRQASVVLQNISLLNETRRRLQEVNLLLEFSRRLSGLNPDQMIKALLESGRRVLPSAHAGVVLLWNEQSQFLEPGAISGYADNDSMMRIAYRMGEALPGIVFEEKIARHVDEVNFPHDYVLPAEDLGIYRQGTGGRLPVSSLLIPIIAGDKSIGLLVLDNFNTPSAFKLEDEALMISLAQQVALSLENVRLVHTSTERAGQLQALNDVATAMTSSLRSDALIASLLDQLKPVLPFDTATLWLRDRELLTVGAARGFPDAEKRLGLTVAVADSALFKEMIKSAQPLMIGDVRDDPRFPAVEAPRLSWLGIPVISKGELTGVIALEKWQSYFYTRELIQLASTFASQAAVALDNANLYEDSLNRASELDERSQRLFLLNRFSSNLSGVLNGSQILDLTAQELQRALNVKRVYAVSFERSQALWVAASPNTDQGLPKILPDAPLFSRLRESLGIFTTENIKTEPDLLPLLDFIGRDVSSLLVLPLSSGQYLRALLFVQVAGEGYFPLNKVELARTISNQAAIALENARLYQSTVRTAEQFAILNRASADIGASLDPEAIYVSAHQAAKLLMPLDAFTIGLLMDGQQDIETVYNVNRNERVPSVHLAFGQGMIGRVIQSGKPFISEDQDPGGPDKQVEEDLSSGSSMVVPMTLAGKTIGALSAQSHQKMAYTDEDVQILGTLANQVIISIQNARLFGETQRLAQELEQRVIERTTQLQREQQNTETLLRILTEVSSSLDLDRALNRTLSLLNEATSAEQGTIMLLNADDNLLHYRAGYGYLSDRRDADERGHTLKIGEGLAGRVVQTREPVLIDDLQEDPNWEPSALTSSREHRSTIVTPLLVGEDVIGVLMVFHRQRSFFSREGLNLVNAIASQVAVAINNAHLYELIRDQAERLGSMLRTRQEEASRSQAILEAVADGVLVTGPDNRITFINSSIQQILAIDAESAVGKSLEDLGDLFGKASSTWMETIQSWSKAPGAYETGDSYAEQLELGDGRIALIHLAPVMMQNDFLGTVSIFRDITHEVEVDRLKSEFVATVSHELRTPMTAIKGYVDVLLMGAAGAVEENQSHFLTIVRNNIDRLNILVDDLLDISRIEAGRVILSPQQLDLRVMAENVIADVQRRSTDEQKPMALSLEVARNLPPVYGDSERVRQIFDNLLDNAYHYTQENGTIKVRIHSLKATEVQVDVTDNGVGIAKPEQERVFERFYRGEHPFVLATPGTGLGLPIVKQLVEMHNGRIWMSSKGIIGQGSTFSFTLPVYKDK